MKNIFKKDRTLSVVLSVFLSFLFVFATVNAATTISTNITTGGTLDVTGATALNGNVTLGDAVADVITANGYLTQARIGTGSTFGHVGTIGADELGVEGNAEFDGTTWFDGILHASSTTLLGGALTTYGSSTFGDAAADVNLFTGTLQASTTALFTGGLTSYGSSTFGDAAADVNLFTGTLQASTTALFTNGLTSYSTLVSTSTGQLVDFDYNYAGTAAAKALDIRGTYLGNLTTNDAEMFYVRSQYNGSYGDYAGAGGNGDTVGMFRGYIGANQAGTGTIFTGLRAGMNLDSGVTVSSGPGYIAGGHITTYVPADAYAKTNKALIIAPRNDSATPGVAGSQYIGTQLYLHEANKSVEAWGLDIYTEASGANMDSAINIRNGGSEKYNYGIDMNDATTLGRADIRLANGDTIANPSASSTVMSGTLTATGAVAATTYVSSPSFQVGAGTTITTTATPSKATLQQASYWGVVTTGAPVDIDIPAMDQVDVGRHLLFSITTGGTNALTVTSGSGMTVVQATASTTATTFPGTAEDVGDAIDCLITTTARAFCTTYAAD